MLGKTVVCQMAKILVNVVATIINSGMSFYVENDVLYWVDKFAAIGLVFSGTKSEQHSFTFWLSRHLAVQKHPGEHQVIDANQFWLPARLHLLRLQASATQQQSRVWLEFKTT